MLRAIAIVSVVLNMVLVAFLAAPHFRETTSEAGQLRRDSQAIADLQDGSGSRLSDILRSVDIAQSSASMVLAAHACAQELVGPHEYWRPAYLQDAAVATDRYAVLETVRAALSTLRPKIAADPDVAVVYRPYERIYPFLSPEKQIALQRVRTGHQRRLVDIGEPGPRAATAVSQSLQQMNEEIKSLLTDDEYFEYSLREAPMAQQLLATGFNFTEQEFRKVFSIHFAGGAPSLSAVTSTSSADHREQILAALGASRFIEFERVRDPVYRLLWSYAGRHGLTEASINTAYGLIHESNQELARMRADGGAGAAKSNEVSAIYNERDRGLRSSLGDAAFREISRQLGVFELTPVTRINVQAR